MESSLTAAELDRWAAERLIGWHYVDNPPSPPTLYSIYDKDNKFVMMAKDWRPSDPDTGQIWRVIDKLRSQDFNIEINCSMNYHVVIYTPTAMFKADDINPCLAILKAAYAALEGK